MPDFRIDRETVRRYAHCGNVAGFHELPATSKPSSIQVSGLSAWTRQLPEVEHKMNAPEFDWNRFNELAKTDRWLNSKLTFLKTATFRIVSPDGSRDLQILEG